MLDSRVILQKRVLSKLSNRYPVVMTAYLESVSPKIDSELEDIDKILDTAEKINKEYYNMMYSFKVKEVENGKVKYNKKGSGYIPDNIDAREFSKQMRKIDAKKDYIKSEIQNLKHQANRPDTNADDKKEISNDISSFEKRLKSISDRQYKLQGDRADTNKKIKSDIAGKEETKIRIFTKAANKLPKILNKEKEFKFAKKFNKSITEASVEMINEVNTLYNNKSISDSDKNTIISCIQESVSEFNYMRSYDTNGFPSVEFNNNLKSYSDIYEMEFMESIKIINDSMFEYLSESALNSYQFLLRKVSSYDDLPTDVSLYKECCDCKNDVAVTIAFIALETALSSEISLSDCGEIFGVLESVAFNEFSVGNMLPQIGSTEGYGTELANSSIEDIIKSTNALIDSKEEKIFEESSKDSNGNIIFDREIKSFCMKIYRCLGVEKDQVDKELEECRTLNGKKYFLDIPENTNSKNISEITSAIKSSGFSKIDGLNYKKTVKNVDIIINYREGSADIMATYNINDKESKDVSESVDLYQEAVINADRYIDLFDSYESVMNLLHLDSDDIIKLAKCNILMERVDDEEIINTINEFKNKTYKNKNSLLMTENASVCYDEICKNPLMQAISNNFDALYESEANIDDDIKAVLTKLHRKGYGTLYSCSGHNGTRKKEDMYRDGIYKGKLYTTARITFDKVYKFSNVPNGWYKTDKDNKTFFYVTPVTYNENHGTPDEAFAKWKSVYLENLRTWAKNVPENTTHTTESVSDILDQIYNDFV